MNLMKLLLVSTLMLAAPWSLAAQEEPAEALQTLVLGRRTNGNGASEQRAPRQVA